jgi:hypothetical protein
MDQYFDQRIEQIGDNDSESKVRFPPAIRQIEKQ